MKIVYTILSVAGWAWCAVALLYGIAVSRRVKQEGFEVVERHDQ